MAQHIGCIAHECRSSGAAHEFGEACHAGECMQAGFWGLVARRTSLGWQIGTEDSGEVSATPWASAAQEDQRARTLCPNQRLTLLWSRRGTNLGSTGPNTKTAKPDASFLDGVALRNYAAAPGTQDSKNSGRGSIDATAGQTITT
jgi:hypothetical protein